MKTKFFLCCAAALAIGTSGGLIIGYFPMFPSLRTPQGYYAVMAAFCGLTMGAWATHPDTLEALFQGPSDLSKTRKLASSLAIAATFVWACMPGRMEHALNLFIWLPAVVVGAVVTVHLSEMNASERTSWRGCAKLCVGDALFASIISYAFGLAVRPPTQTNAGLKEGIMLAICAVILADCWRERSQTVGQLQTDPITLRSS